MTLATTCSRRRSASIAACVLLTLVGVVSGLAWPVRADEPTPLRLCADPDNLPFSSANADTPGFYIEVGQQIAHVLGRPFQPLWVPTYYAKRQIRKKLLAGQCDGFVGVPDDPDFMGPRLIDSQPITRLGYALVAPPAMHVNSPQDLHGRRVAVQFASMPQNLLANETDVQMVTVLSPEEAMHDLAEGKADAAFIWGASAGWLNLSMMHGVYRVVPVVDEKPWEAAIGFPRDQAGLRDQVNGALSGLGTTINSLAVKYGFPIAASKPVAVPAATDAQAAAEPTPAPRASSPPAATPPATTEPAQSDATAKAATPAGFTPAAPTVENIEAGHKLFNLTCAHCHGPDAVQGEQRRNLRLLRQRYGDEMPKTFYYTVTHGRVSKGMPNWSGIVSDEEFQKILAFLTSVQEPPS